MDWIYNFTTIWIIYYCSVAMLVIEATRESLGWDMRKQIDAQWLSDSLTWHSLAATPSIWGHTLSKHLSLFYTQVNFTAMPEAGSVQKHWACLDQSLQSDPSSFLPTPPSLSPVLYPPPSLERKHSNHLVCTPSLPPPPPLFFFFFLSQWHWWSVFLHSSSSK